MTSVVAQQFDLPPELWSQIFAHLKPQQLLRIRLVCHRWKAIVDRERSLWARLRIKFPDEVTLDENFRPFIAPAADVQLEAVRIVTVDSWWPTHLTCVRMRGCQVSLESFLGMLRRTPNLTQLELIYVEFTSGGNPEVVDFRLERLESLELIQYSDDLLDLFGRLCPRLRELSLEDDGEHDRVTARLIESVQDTLQRLKLWMTPYVLQKMSLLERLQLKSVELTDLQEDEYALSVSRFQPSLEELLVTIRRNSVLCEIGTNLPGLKRLTVGLVEEDGLDFLATMPLLEELDIGGGQEALNFNGFHCPNLTKLTLDGVELVASSLRVLSSKLKELKFEKCAMDSWSDLLAVLAAQSSLLRLDLWRFDVFLADHDFLPSPNRLPSYRTPNPSNRSRTSRTNFRTASSSPLRISTRSNALGHRIRRCRKPPVTVTPSQASSVSWVSRGNARYTARNVASSRFGSRFSVRVLRWGERVISWRRDLLGIWSPSRSSRVWSRLVVRGWMKRVSVRSQSLSDRSWRLGEPFRNEGRLACSKDK
ncbi:conserved hypothetical protein [Culex quinquefasciatus]|uniref:F-box domain-containing protein n=1 Tax=Culex quinquefasciatus TaxID=7176 RepID=B0XB17_CULQU|nr:conserved hypothetical protein [Culex quinquefasciatus]|eukprot:XP_001866839.1 conserved hypothetical protein [Culex quinquefasciatus]